MCFAFCLFMCLVTSLARTSQRRLPEKPVLNELSKFLG